MLEPAKKHASELAETGFYAEFASDTAAVAAARRLIERGHAVLDAFTPRPVAALEEVVAPGRSSLNRTVFVWGAIGACTGLGIEWACNAWDYPLNVGGRPPFALRASMPIAFEAMVLFAALTAFFGFMHRAGLPWLAHPAFGVPGFERASNDRFFLLVERTGANDEELHALLVELGAVSVSGPPALERPSRETDAVVVTPSPEPAE